VIKAREFPLAFNQAVLPILFPYSFNCPVKSNYTTHSTPLKSRPLEATSVAKSKALASLSKL